MYVCVCVYVCVCAHMSVYIYVPVHEGSHGGQKISDLLELERQRTDDPDVGAGN